VWMLRRVLSSPLDTVIPSREAPGYTLVTLATFPVRLIIFGLYLGPLLDLIIAQ